VTEPRVHLVPALDGVRGVAVGLVVLFHLRPDLLPGGWVGMSIFFSLSGFLITRLLLTEVQRDGTVSLRRFWIRRARRLLPALYALLAAVAVVLVVHGTWTARVRGATWSSLLYVNNWWQLHHATDYWAQFDTTRPPFEHLWSLSVEEQFYVAWPLVVFAATRWARRPLAAIGVAATVITVWGVAFGLAMAHFGWGGMTAQYYNTFVRAAELLAGGLLAVVLAARPDLWSTARARRHLDLIACVLLAVLVGVSVVLDGAGARFVADGGMFAAGVATVVVIAAALRGGVVASLLGLRPLRWMGTRCYSLYLWHWPVIVLVTPANCGLEGWALALFRTGLIVAASVLSFWLVEEPIRRGHGIRTVAVQLAGVMR